MKKLTGRHKTLEKSLKQSFKWLDGLVDVHKIVLGTTDNARHKYSPGTLRVKEVRSNGVFLNCYSGRGITEAFVTSKDPRKLSEVILKKFS